MVAINISFGHFAYSVTSESIFSVKKKIVLKKFNRQRLRLRYVDDFDFASAIETLGKKVKKIIERRN